MRIEVINTGAELLVGRVLNTHQQWLCRQLTDLGYEVSRQACVSDDGAQIQAAVSESLPRADVIITTGGLGPTSDDRTRDFIAQMLGRKLVLHPATRSRIEKFFAARGRPMPANVQVQAMAPKGAVVLPNANGTAPGLALQTNRGRQWLILLPGPPRELRPMFLTSVVPLLRREFPLVSNNICRTIKTTGLGESVVEEKIAGAWQPLVRDGLELAYCARVGQVDVRLAGRGRKAGALLAEGAARVESLLGPAIFGADDDSLESVVIGLLTGLGKNRGRGGILHRRFSGASADQCSRLQRGLSWRRHCLQQSGQTGNFGRAGGNLAPAWSGQRSGGPRNGRWRAPSFARRLRSGRDGRGGTRRRHAG